MINFYHRFILVASNIMRPLFAASRGKPTDSVCWTDAMVAAFLSSKDALANTTLLSHPRKGAATSLTVNASDVAIGGVLKQRIDGSWRPPLIFQQAPKSY